ncbi:deoxyribodipyrimidine photo-lyase [Hymenobacter luteus]|uniref:Deoxyribodipyrimidine photo-lyase n=2 Tax=Hymenobacter TaxID=89966 RepID=A0A7W9WB05_9BACT|nr:MULTISPECIES: deoxyribodipyrimidine photo-lyase [Hymenobacter]MBB4601285.1 deoxyribodipyrimidine photo-lyase [Hymenobacter latericoloratus]MBB6058508.1 deoxyribodipyrimidine photo-lyase [Hymenobacter luteus]
MKITLFWHRRDLRQHDNAGLAAALQSGHPVVPLFIYDREILDLLPSRRDARVTFIYDEVERLARQTEQQGGTFLAFYGRPLEVFEQLLSQHEVAAIYTNEDYEPYATERDTAVAALAARHGVAFHALKDQVIFAKNELLGKSGKPARVFGAYRKAWLEKLRDEHLQPYPSADLYTAPNLAQLPQPAPRPTLASMGFEEFRQQVPANELPPEELVRNYHLTRDSPGRVDSSTRRSVHLRFGTLSVRELMRQARDLNPKLLAELIWRDYFMLLLWHYPATATESFEPRLRQVPYRNNEAEFQAWCEGRTGYPLVDAGMRELNQTGYLPNRARIAAAGFLVKHLLIDWRWGDRYFADKLLDYDMAQNVGNWQWMAGTGVVAAPWFRVYSPQSQLDSYDADRAYVKRWLPELGTSAYPQPIVDHKFARERAIETLRTAYRAAGQ